MDRVNTAEQGCPSGLAPAADGHESADPRAFVRQKSGAKQLDLAVYGAKCAGCISKIEGGLKRLPGVSEARLNLSTQKLHVEWNGHLDARRITNTLTSLGYRVAPYDPTASEKENDEYGKKLLKCLGVAGFAMANIMMLLSIPVWASGEGGMGEGTREFLHLISALIAVPAAAYAGRPFFDSAWSALRNGNANMDVPISLAVILTIGVSLFESLHGGDTVYFEAAVMLLFFLLIGRWLDHSLRNRARAAARDLLALQAVTVSRQTADHHVESVAAKDIAVGDLLRIAPGDRLPVDGEIVDGTSDFDLSLVTGESAPVVRGPGDAIQSGTVNLSANLLVRATATADRSLVAELVRLVEVGQQTRNSYVRLADKAARAYVPIVHTAAALTFLGWFFIGGIGFRDSLMTAVAVLIITCPCALGLATPAVQVVATGILFKRGILVKSGDALERLSKITHVIFDKTGTLTTGALTWLNADSLSAADRERIAAVARGSRHPVSRSIVHALGGGPVADQVVETPGQGVSGVVDGVTVKIGRAAFVGQEGHNLEGNTTRTWVKIGESYPQEFLFEDSVRADASDVVSKLKEKGISVSMLTGDRKDVAQRIAASIGIDEVHAEVTPTEKSDVIDALRGEGKIVAMVGDGLNDAPALARADVSLSPGSAADAAQSAADFVFQGNSLKPILAAYHMAKLSQRRIVENFAFAALYNAIASPMAMAGLVTPLFAALAMSGSSLIVTLNALRLRVGQGNLK